MFRLTDYSRLYGSERDPIDIPVRLVLVLDRGILIASARDSLIRERCHTMSWREIPDEPKETVKSFVDRFRKKARFLVDESLGREVATVLNDRKWNVKFVDEAGLCGRSDEDVMAFAWRDDRILLTHDRDFLDDRRFPPYRNPGVVILPGADGKEADLISALAGLLAIVGPFREGYRHSKVVISSDRIWTFIKRNNETGAMEKTRLRIRKNGPTEIWVDE